jgi:hypothetical protein
MENNSAAANPRKTNILLDFSNKKYYIDIPFLSVYFHKKQ